MAADVPSHNDTSIFAIMNKEFYLPEWEITMSYDNGTFLDDDNFIVENNPPVNPMWIFVLIAAVCIFVTIVGVGLSLVIQRNADTMNRNVKATQTALALGITPSPSATAISEFDLTATAVVATNWQFQPTATWLPAVDSIGYSVTTTPAPIVAQSGGVWLPPTVTPAPYFPPPMATQSWATPIPWATATPYAPPVMATYAPPLPTAESVTPPSMPPLVVSAPICGVNPLYMGRDPRIGCRMPIGEVITSTQLWVNNVLVTNMTNLVGWEAVSTPPTAQPGQMVIWQAQSNMACVAWNPSITLGPTDSVFVRINTNTGRVIDNLIIVHQYTHTINPWPAAHACGYSPDRTQLRAEIGDTLSRFMLALDLQPTDALWLAWWNMYHNYNLTVGQVYQVPPEWLYGVPSGGK